MELNASPENTVILNTPIKRGESEIA
ncbi:phage tail assembly protein, partial [Bacillus thuringiensis]|nr:phage tail assembly protein [Bacillus thuringiensis]